MNNWMAIWTVLLVCGIGVFVLMSVLVTIGGAKDIKQLFRSLKKDRQDDERDTEN